jgi:hypothetical protein
LRPEPVLQAWESHLAGRRNDARQLWAVCCFQAWLDHQRRSPRPEPSRVA